VNFSAILTLGTIWQDHTYYCKNVRNFKPKPAGPAFTPLSWEDFIRLTTEAIAKLPIDNNCHSERISYFQKVEILHFVQDDRKTSFARGSTDKGYFQPTAGAMG